MRVKALYTVLSKKYADGQMLFVSDVSLKGPKTKDARLMLTQFGSISGYESLKDRRNNALYLVLPKADANVKKSFANMGNVLVGTVNTINPVDMLTYKYVLFATPEEVVNMIAAKSLPKEVTAN